MSTSQGKYPGTDQTEGKLSIVKRIVRWWHSPHPTWARLNQVVAGAHPSVTETGEIRRAELSAWIALLLAFLSAVAVVAMVLTRGQLIRMYGIVCSFWQVFRWQLTVSAAPGITPGAAG